MFFNFHSMMTQNENLIYIFQKPDFILLHSRARYRAHKCSKCFERLTKNTFLTSSKHISETYLIWLMNYLLDGNDDCFTSKIFNIFGKLSCFTMTYTCAHFGAHEISDKINVLYFPQKSIISISTFPLFH